MRRCHVFLWLLGTLAALFFLMLGHASLRRGASRADLLEKTRFVRELCLTDLCLATEANYTRHLSQADFSTPFQDNPTSLERFPSGTWLQPRWHVRSNHGKLDRTATQHP